MKYLVLLLNTVFAPGIYFAHFYYEWTHREQTSALFLIGTGLFLFYMPISFAVLWFLFY